MWFYLLFGQSLQLQLLLAEQLGPVETTLRLFFDLLLQQSGSERHLNQASLGRGETVRWESLLTQTQVFKDGMKSILCFSVHIFRLKYSYTPLQL